ncbi:nuclear transport factor 2 family protein [Actinokineospora xionganensis]|uniref:Nuclear transport factor 2 family protein n=1 Tax=Actinokineospora xionganensis TaxID=2684470 RepID=A0ABR7L5L3_9PSEU|nr:nuclear transport factor 2 family protein [Actinokineospora xionganensis]MBC6447739.1 nuclear transport factor 2 family protein [Actinokineospora xionganensis]
MYQPTDEAVESVRQWFVDYDALAERGAVEEMADLAVFPLNLATDVPGGHAAVAQWTREEFVRTMSEVVGGGAAMESTRTPRFLSENLVVVVTEAAVTVEGERQELTYADVLVRTPNGWAFQTMIQGGWGHGWDPARRG